MTQRHVESAWETESGKRVNTREHVVDLTRVSRVVPIVPIIGWSRRVLWRRKRNFVSGRHPLLMVLIMMSAGHHLMMRLLVILMMHARMARVIDRGLLRVLAWNKSNDR